MEVLTPTHRPGTTVDQSPRLSSSTTTYGSELERASCSESSSSAGLAEAVEEKGGRETVFVAVGKSADKAVALLRWTLRKFGSCPVCLAHVHQPSSTIPTLLGKLPASHANAVVVAAYRKEEREKTRKLLDGYLSLCYKRKVKASIVTAEAEQVQTGLVDLIVKHHIKKLVMGAVPEGCMKVKKSSSKANYAAKNAPPFCEIWFVHKGKNIWTREAFEGFNLDAVIHQSDAGTEEGLRSKSSGSCKTESLCRDELVQLSSSHVDISGVKDWIKDTDVGREDDLVLSQPSCSSIIKNDQHCAGSSFHATSTGNSCFARTSSGKEQITMDSDLNAEEEILLGQLAKVKAEVAKSKDEAYMESVKRENLEAKAIQAIIKTKDLEAAYTLEAKLRKDSEVALKATTHERDRNSEQRLDITRELHKTGTNVVVLSSRVQEADCRCNEAAEELIFIQASIASLGQEKQNLWRQTMDADCWLERWRNGKVARASSRNVNSVFLDNIPGLVKFSLLDLQTATCHFSNSFKLREGGYGCVYKGELLGKTVAIKQLRVLNVQGPSQFQKEVQVLGKIRHPHLITLIGTCPEGWALVYDYLPNSSLHNRLFNKSNHLPLPWKDRTRLISEISCALLFLHSSYPEKIIHGDLKPENILLDSELCCKICDFGICRLVTEESLRCPSFRGYGAPNGAFPYADPEFSRTGVLTPKSDAYSFGMVVLQLLTGKCPWGLVADARKAVSQGKLASILDRSAGDWPTPVADKLAKLGLDLCKSNSHDRPALTPTMVRDLQNLHMSEERPVLSYFLCPILQEIMLDPVVAADGFTYERDALKGWLENGRETSPMTNLPLDHLHLTPNHTLRRAIQDWLCKS